MHTTSKGLNCKQLLQLRGSRSLKVSYKVKVYSCINLYVHALLVHIKVTFCYNMCSLPMCILQQLVMTACMLCRIIVMASARCNSSTVTNPECFTVSDSTQCQTEVNEVSSVSSELVTAVRLQMIEWDDKKTELVTGKESFGCIYSSKSELVIDMTK